MINIRRLRLATAVAAVVLLLAQAGATALLIERGHRAGVAAARDTVGRAAHAAAASINRAFVQVDAMLAGMPAVLLPLGRNGQQAADADAISAVLRELNNQNFTVRDVLLIDADGAPIATALPVSRRHHLPPAIEAHFREEVGRSGGVSIAGPEQNPSTGEWTTFFARRVEIQGLGPTLAVAEVPVPLIQSLLSAGGEDQGLRTTLERAGGTLLASLPHDEARIGQRLSPSAAALAAAAETAVHRGRFGDFPVFAAARQTLYPALSVTAALDTDAALAGWYSDRRRMVIVSGALGLLIASLALALILALGQRERMETERSRARRLLENALESMTDGFVMFDAEDRLIACNSRYLDFYRISAPFIRPGARFEDIVREGALRGQYPQAGNDIEEFVARMVAFHHAEGPPIERLLPDGRWILIDARRTPDGNTVGIRTDITPLKRAMEDLAAARDAAAAAGLAKGQFLAGMSHELRTPLNGILGFAEVLLQDPRLADDQREQVRTVQETGHHLLELVNGLLDLSKIEAGRLDLHPRPTPLRELLEGCASLLNPEIRRKAQVLALDLPPDLPPAVEADPTRLRQLLLNLLSNAVKFAPPGGRVALSARRLPDGALRFEVQDSGPGVPADKQHLLFEEFVQLAPAAPEATGAGLGLAISARLAALMGGRIGCISEDGQGGLFWVELPLPEVAPPTAAALAQAVPPEPLSAEGRRLRLLVVDDIEVNRRVAQAMLSGMGHAVHLVDCGEEAVAALARGETFDAVLMDLQMPGMDGLEATRRIRGLPVPAGLTPVFALTASVLPEQVEACLAAGMNGHLAKPIERKALRTALAAIAGGAGALAAEGDAPALLDTVVIEALERELGPDAPGILAEFAAELRCALTLLAEASSEKREDPQHVQQAVHRILGAARTLGAARLAAEAERLQRAATAGDPAPALQASIAELAKATLPRLDARLPSAAAAEPEAAAQA